MKKRGPTPICGAPNCLAGSSSCVLPLGHAGNHAVVHGANGWTNGELSERIITLENRLAEAHRANQSPGAAVSEPLAMILHCPMCHARHIDKGEFATKPHHTHACQSCGLAWRPAIHPTVGVQFLPGFKDEE